MQDYSGFLELEFNKTVRPFIEYRYRDFDVDESARWELGIRARPQEIPLDYVSASYVHENGYAGQYEDLYLAARYTVNPKLSISTRATFYLYSNKAEDKIFLPVFSFDPVYGDILFEEHRRDYSFNLYLAMLHHLNPRMSVVAGFEYSRTPNLNYDLRGVFKFTYRFWSPIKVEGGVE